MNDEEIDRECVEIIEDPTEVFRKEIKRLRSENDKLKQTLHYVASRSASYANDYDNDAFRIIEIIIRDALHKLQKEALK